MNFRWLPSPRRQQRRQQLLRHRPWGQPFRLVDYLLPRRAVRPQIHRRAALSRRRTAVHRQRRRSPAAARRQAVLRQQPSGQSRLLRRLQHDPIGLLKIAGVDMSSPAPVNAALKLFGELVDELEKLM